LFRGSEIDGQPASVHLQNLLEWRKSLPQSWQWQDEDPPATTVSSARLRGKYYLVTCAITEPFLHYAVECMKEWREVATNDLRSKQLPRVNFKLPQADRGEPLPATQHEAEKAGEIIAAAKLCVESMMKSIVAFDGVNPGGLWIDTNIYSTAQA